MVWRRPNAFLSPMEHEAKRKFCATRVKGGNPLRVQGGARESLPSGNPAAKRTPNPTKQVKRLALYRRQTVVASVQYSPACVISPFVAYLPPCPVLFFFPGFRVAASGGAKMPILAQILFFAKNSAFFGKFVRGRGETTAQMRQKNVGKHSGAGRVWKGANPNRNRQKAFIRQK